MNVHSRGGHLLLAAAAYGSLLIVSFVVRSTRVPVAAVSTVRNGGPIDRVALVQAVDGDSLTSRPIRLAYRDYAPASGSAATTIVLVHGSPGHMDDFAALAPRLAQRARIVVPDLPGFGASTRTLPDYSFRAHAVYLRQLLDQLSIRRAHVLGYSMGGGVVLSFSEQSPDRLASLTMLSAIGVQEMELTGHYGINHLVHGAQLAALWLLREGTPHMGRLDDVMLGVPYARNFFDSDQRPLREALRRVTVPTLIVHGVGDGQVPVEAAREHARLVPQSELYLLDGDHVLLFAKSREVATLITAFIDRTEKGLARRRADAEPERLRAAVPVFDHPRYPPVRGIAAAVFSAALTGATFISDSFGAAAGGVLVAQGRIRGVGAVGASFLGSFLANLLIFIGTRCVSSTHLERPPIRWLLSPGRIVRRIPWIVQGHGYVQSIWALSGHRRTSTVAVAHAGIRFWPFLIACLVTSLLWSAVAVGVATVVTVALVAIAPSERVALVIPTAVATATTALIFNVFSRAMTAKGRRLLLSSWRRCTRWEFWPPWIFYPPLLLYVAYLAVKHRGLTVFTAANPAILAGGFVGESKYGILQGLGTSPEYVARSHLIAGSLGGLAKLAEANAFMGREALTLPVVLKPNQGQRGSGVVLVRTAEALERFLSESSVDTIVQEYVAGAEFGVFYYRRPSESRGQIFSVTEKQFPTVVGDGQRTLEELILDDDRAVCAARLYCDRHRDHLSEVPTAGKSVRLVELGTHCRGAMFLDGAWVLTSALAIRFDEIARGYDGFYFGRFDVRVNGGVDAFREGHGFKIIELNGVTSEATHIYHPGTPLITAYRVLMNQWRIAFEIGAENRRRDVAPTSLGVLARLMREYRGVAAGHLSETLHDEADPLSTLEVGK